MELMHIYNLSKRYGELEVLDGVNLDFHQGKVYGLVGENGAGKTTLFKCMMGLTDYQGEVTQADVLSVGYMPADTFYYPLITAKEHIEFCVKAKGLSINEEEIQRLNEMFELPLNRFASRFSTGMKKKLAFMTLLLQKNDLMILDEPFNGVDLKGCINMRNIIKEAKSEGKTFIISSHQITALHEICDCIDFLCKHTILKRYRDESVEEIEDDILKII